MLSNFCDCVPRQRKVESPYLYSSISGPKLESLWLISRHPAVRMALYRFSQRRVMCMLGIGRSMCIPRDKNVCCCVWALYCWIHVFRQRKVETPYLYSSIPGPKLNSLRFISRDTSIHDDGIRVLNLGCWVRWTTGGGSPIFRRLVDTTNVYAYTLELFVRCCKHPSTEFSSKDKQKSARINTLATANRRR